MIRKTAFVFSCMLMITNASFAADTPFSFKFEHQSNYSSPELMTDEEAWSAFSRQNVLSHEPVRFSQYDATWAYLIDNHTVDFDLGVKLRHLSGKYQKLNKQATVYKFDQTLPLLHASALFTLPFRGLSAGVEGSHLNYDDSLIFDYRAKVSYQWRDGFGLQGGWQHQQFNLEHSNNTVTEFQSQGPFIDFYLKF